MSGNATDEEETDEENEQKSIVIDVGSGMLKAGFAGDDAPLVKCPTILGCPRVKHAMIGFGGKDVYVGDEAQNRRGILTLSYPIERGIVKDWDGIEKIWHHTFYEELHIDPEEYKVLLADSAMIMKDREKMAQIMFETFNVPSFYMVMQAVLALSASGRTAGIVLDSGYGVTNVVPVYEGNAVSHAVEHIEFGGQDITEYLAKLLTSSGYSFTTPAEQEIVKDIKEKCCYVAFDIDKELRASYEDPNLVRQYELPDGNIVALRAEQFGVPEALFNPSLLGIDAPGIHTSIHNNIIKCFPHPHPKHFYPNILLAGGNSMFEGLKERLKKEITNIMSPSMVAKVIAPPERKYSAWIGGSIYASLSAMKEKWITK